MEEDPGLMMPESEPTPPASAIVRETPEPSQSRKSLVGEWLNKIHRAKAHWKPVHRRMREDTDFYMGKQWPNSSDDTLYVANLVQKHVQNRVAALYAKNPKVVCKRRRTVDFAIWDGDPSSFQNAQVLAQQAAMQGLPPPAQVTALIQDIQQGTESRRRADRVAKTLEIVFHHIVEAQALKPQMKQLIRRVCVTGVGFLKLGYHRVMGQRPEDVAKVTDITEQLSMLERLIADRQDGRILEDQAKAEQLRILLSELANKQDMVVDEGLVFDFPVSESVIIDPRCRQLKGFVGAEWVAQEFLLTVDEVKEIYKVDLGKSFVAHEDDRTRGMDEGEDDRQRSLAKVYEVYCKRDGLKYVLADGYPEFLTEPACPDLKLRRFWPIFVLAFNEVESDRDIYPPSDVRLAMPIQREYNLARQRLREHRHANRPLYVTPTGMMTKEEAEKLSTRNPHDVIQLSALQPGQDVGSVLQVVKPAPIDPALYDTSMYLDDFYRVLGSQEANFGGTGSSTATEVSVAESSRMTAMGSSIDELDEFLIDLARASGEVLLANMNASTATKIAGVGASWPTLSPQEISDQLLLEIEAGSSGRPNKAAEVQMLERVGPLLMQVPGVSPVWFAKQAINRWDEGLDVEDAILSGVPSMVAMNAQKQMAAQSPMGGGATPEAAMGGMTPAPSPALPGGTNGPNVAAQSPPSPTG
jgi:hypothetical protein